MQYGANCANNEAKDSDRVLRAAASYRQIHAWTPPIDAAERPKEASFCQIGVSDRQKDASFSQIDVSDRQKDVSFSQIGVSDRQKDVSFCQKDLPFWPIWRPFSNIQTRFSRFNPLI